MKVIHFESGLGNQMFNYVEYLMACRHNSADECVIENLIYEIGECNDVICQWNGYELDRIFGIQCPNIKDTFNDEQWDRIISHVRQSEFWNDNWNYSSPIIQSFSQEGLELENFTCSFGVNGQAGIIGKIKEKIRMHSTFYYNTKRIIKAHNSQRYIQIKGIQEQQFLDGIQSDLDVYCGQTLMFQKKGRDIELIDKEIRDAFIFPKLNTKNDLKISEIINSTESVAIHARRGDFLSRNGVLYKGGYFKRSIKYVKKHVENPVFFFFCDPGSINWCKENEKIFGLDFKKDKVYFIDWNKDDSSFRDMQLMSLCKHNIITGSSFGWWGAYLNRNPNKITISPDVTINTTMHL